MTLTNLTPEPIIIDVVVLQYSHKHGADLELHRTEAAALRSMADHCSLYINDFQRGPADVAEMMKLLASPSLWEEHLPSAWEEYTHEAETFEIFTLPLNLNE